MTRHQSALTCPPFAIGPFDEKRRRSSLDKNKRLEDIIIAAWADIGVGVVVSVDAAKMPCEITSNLVNWLPAKARDEQP